MNTQTDLHTHSIYSGDGELTPAALIERAKAADIRVVALTDHNTMRGTAEARVAAKKSGLSFLSGIEIDTTYNGRNFHLLGYGLDENARDIADIDEQIHDEELKASAKYIELIHEMGFFFDDAAVLAKAKNGVVVGEMIAEVVLADSRNDGNELLREFRDGGRLANNPLVNFFWEFMSLGKPAYVPMKFPDFADAARTIKRNGGAAILAHPGANVGQNAAIVESLITVGIDGIECYSNYHDDATTDFYKKIAADHDLIITERGGVTIQ